MCGITLDEACMLTRTREGTATKHIKRAFAAMSIEHDEKRTRGFPPPPPDDYTALLYWKSETGAPWMVWHRKKYYDPAAGVFRKVPKHAEFARVTSYLRITLGD